MRGVAARLLPAILVVLGVTTPLRSTEILTVRCPEVDAFILGGGLGEFEAATAKLEVATHGHLSLSEFTDDAELARYAIRAFLWNNTTLGLDENVTFLLLDRRIEQFLASDLDGDGHDELLCISRGNVAGSFPPAQLDVVAKSGLIVAPSRYTAGLRTLRLERKGQRVLLIGGRDWRERFRRFLRVKDGTVVTSRW